MLVEFSVENFRSFKDRQTLSMVASSDVSHLDNNTFAAPGNNKFRLNNTTVIYGPNASGKSNLINAMGFLENFVCSSATKVQEGDKIPVSQFKLDARYSDMPSQFDVMFIQNNVRYNYCISVKKDKVVEEWLSSYPKNRRQIWFHRQYDKSDDNYHWFFGPELRGEKERIKGFVRKNSLFLSHAAQNSHPQLSLVYKWFSETFARLISPEHASGWTASRCSEDPEFCKSVVKFLEVTDSGIVGIETKEIDIDKKIFKVLNEDVIKEIIGDDNMKARKILTVHKDTTTGKDIIFDFNDESDGTKRIFSFAGPCMDVLKKGMVMYVDEIDRSLHPKLSRHLISIFHNKKINNNNAQFIATSHDISLLDKNLLRRDQIWFVKKEKDGSSKLYSLTDYSPRKDESLQKGYLLGRYGAIPFVEEGALL